MTRHADIVKALAAVIMAVIVTGVYVLVGGFTPATTTSAMALSDQAKKLPHMAAELQEKKTATLPPAPPYVPPPYRGNSPYGAQTGPAIPAGFVFPERITQSEFVQKKALTPLLTCHNENYKKRKNGVTVLKSSCHHDYLAADVSVIPYKTIIVAPVSGTVTIVHNPSSCDGFNVPSLSLRSDRKFEGHYLWFYLTHMAPSSVVHYPSGKPWYDGQHVKAGQQIGLGGPAKVGSKTQECADAGISVAHLHMDISTVPDDFARAYEFRNDPLVAEAMYDPMPMLQWAFKRLPK